MNITQFIPLFLLTASLTAADQQQLPASSNSMITVLLTQISEGAGTVQQMGACKRAAEIVRTHPRATIACTGGTLCGTIGVGLHAGGVGLFPELYGSAAILYCFGFASTPLGDRCLTRYDARCCSGCGGAHP